MALVHRASYMQFRHVLERDGKSFGHSDFEGLKKKVTQTLEDTGLIVVHKVRRTERSGAMFEATAQWTGIDPDPTGVERTLRDLWPGKDLPATEEQHVIENEPDHVTLWFALKGDQNRFITGRVLISI